MGILTAAENKQTNKQTKPDSSGLSRMCEKMRRIECLNGETKEFMRETQKETCEERTFKRISEKQEECVMKKPSKEFVRKQKACVMKNFQKDF
jgi:hypothetical protein